MNPDIMDPSGKGAPTLSRPTRSAPPYLLLGLLAVVAVSGINLIGWMKEGLLMFPDPRNWFNAFFVTVGKTEPAGLLVVLAFAFLTALLWIWNDPTALPFRRMRGWQEKQGVWLTAVLVLLTAGAGTWLVFHNHALAADEDMPNFQAEIFLSGHWQVKPPQDLLPLLRLLRPMQTAWDKTTGSWCSGYLPVYAALRTPFLALKIDEWLNPLLGAASVLAFAGIVRILWPSRPSYIVVGVALLAASPQFLVYCMTSYTMSAHLAFNLIWLWLYMQSQSRLFWLTPIVGVLALGLHNPLVHALFATPFLLRLVMDRKWKATVWFVMVYGAGIAYWWSLWRIIQPDFSSATSSPFSMVHPYLWLTQGLDVLALLGWLALPVPLLVMLALGRLRHLPAVLKDCALSCLLTFCFYITISFDQGLGWGDRYFHGAYGCLLLLGMAGWDILQERVGKPRAHWFAFSGLLLTVALLLPLRCIQAEGMVRPFATALAAFRAMDVDIVVYDPRFAWYSSELRRNDPFLRQRPLIISAFGMTATQQKLVAEKFPRLRYVTQSEMASYGLSTQYYVEK